MKDLSVFIAKVMIAAAILFPFLFVISKFYDAKLSDRLSERRPWIINKKDGIYDYLIIGSSRAYTSLSPVVIDSINKTNGLNIGIGGAAFAENLLCLQKFYNNRNTIEYLFVQVDPFGLVDPKSFYPHPFADEKYLMLVNETGLDSIFTANVNPLKHTFRKYFPFFKYAEYNNIYPLNEVITSGSYGTKLDASKGATFLVRDSLNVSRINNWKKVSERSYSASSAQCLKKIVALARKNETKVIFFTAPIYNPYIKNFEPDYYTLRDSLRSFCRQNSIKYLDFHNAEMMQDIGFFNDNIHLNCIGARKFSILFADSLSSFLMKN